MPNNSDIFDKIQRGDLIFTRSEDWTGKFIRFVTKSEINHVAIYLGSGEIIESQIGFGVRKHKLKDYLEDKKCEVFCGSLLQITPKQIEDAISNAKNLLNSPYDLTGQLGILLKITIVRLGLEGFVKFYGKNITQNVRAFWCSELVAYCFEEAGVQLTQEDQRYATPEDIARSPKIDFKNLD